MSAWELDADKRIIPVVALMPEYLDDLARRLGWPQPVDDAGREDERERVRRGLRAIRAEDRKAAQR